MEGTMDKNNIQKGLHVDILQFVCSRNATYGEAQSTLTVAQNMLDLLAQQELWHMRTPAEIPENFNPDQVKLTSLNRGK